MLQIHSASLRHWPRAICFSSLLLALASVSFSAAAAPAPKPERAGFYPLQLPEGEKPFAEKLSAQLRDGAPSLANLSIEMLPRGACLFDEPGCLAAAARDAGLAQIISGRVVQGEQGFSFELHRIAASDGRELGQQRGSVEGGPLDLAGGLEHGLCELLGAAPCEGQLSIRGDGGEHVLVDGQDRGALPISQLKVPIGRHLVRVGDSERRVRIAWHRETALACAGSGSALELIDESGRANPSADERNGAENSSSTAAEHSARAQSTKGFVVPPEAIATAAAPAGSLSPRARAGRLALAAGGALLMAAAGLEVYAQAESSVLSHRYQSQDLTAADAASYGHVHTAGVAALLVGATGAGALGVGGLLILLSPDSAAVQGKF